MPVSVNALGRPDQSFAEVGAVRPQPGYLADRFEYRKPRKRPGLPFGEENGRHTPVKCKCNLNAKGRYRNHVQRQVPGIHRAERCECPVVVHESEAITLGGPGNASYQWLRFTLCRCPRQIECTTPIGNPKDADTDGPTIRSRARPRRRLLYSDCRKAISCCCCAGVKAWKVAVTPCASPPCRKMASFKCCRCIIVHETRFYA
jgi:hypothetical protein